MWKNEQLKSKTLQQNVALKNFVIANLLENLLISIISKSITVNQ